jgi:hypothetical protein
MIRSILIPVFAFTVAAAPSLSGQPGGATERPLDARPIPRDQLVLRYHRLQGPDTDLPALLTAAEKAFGRRLPTEDGPRDNLFTLPGAIAVLETRERADQILNALPEMEAACRPGARSPEVKLESRHFEIKHVKVDRLLGLLSTFQRRVQAMGGEGLVANITTFSDRNVLFVRDTAETIDSISALLKVVDVPEAQQRDTRPFPFTLTCQILRASAEPPKAGSEVPRDLLENLRRLLPHQHHELLGTALVRAPGDGGSEVTMDLTSDLVGVLQLRDLTHDPSTGLVRIESCHLDVRPSNPEAQKPAGSSINIKTPAAITPGETTVVGAAGRATFLLVLRATIH